MTKASTRLVDRLAKAMAPKMSRRGFVARSAIVGSALAVAPTDFILRPMTAYAAICGCSGSSCGCGSTCCDGYTEFCCTLTGVNACPGGTAVGGWWKADGTNLCGGASRYYMDCNVQPGNNPCSCGCANGSCDNRKACCTHFRYGQCHQEIAQMGAIMCRVVTCTPPWQLDGTCTTTTATDEATAGHDGSCLHLPVGSFDTISSGLGSVSVAGWAADPETPDQSIDVHVYVDGGFVTSAVANKSRPDVAAAYPGFGPAHGYDVTIPVAGTDQQVCVYAINRGVPEGNPLLGCRPISRSPFGNFEALRPRPGAIEVQGWAIDPDTKNPVDVQVIVDGAVAATAHANGNRPDVASAYPDYGAAHGFVVDVNVASGAHQVCVTALNLGASAANTSLGCRPSSGLPFGNVDSVEVLPNGLRVSGWAIDPATSQPTSVQVYVDGASAGTFTADGDRPDVAGAYPDYGAGHGFVVDVPVAAGSHQVCVNALDRTNPQRQASIGCRAAVVGGNPFGNFEALHPRPGGVQVQGWAIDPDTTAAIDVQVYVDQQLAGTFRADVDRPDVGAAFPDYGSAHGFLADVSFGAGSHNVCVYALNRGFGSSNPLLGCRVSSSLPFGNFESMATQPNGFRLQGWAIDPDTTSPVDVHVYIDGGFSGSFTANADRPDVGAAYPQYGSAHGFLVDVAATPGTHQVCVYAIDKPGPGSNPNLGCRTATR